MSVPLFKDSDFTDSEIEECKRSKKLLSIDLDVSCGCNLFCTYCYAGEQKPVEGELSLEQLFDIVDQVFEMGAKLICLVGEGEPLLYKNIIKLIKYIRQKNMGVVLITNATLITEELAQQLYDLEVSITVKLDSLDKNTQDKMAGIDGAYEKIQTGINNLLNLNYVSGRRQIAIHTVLGKYNIQEIPSIWCWARERNIFPLVETPIIQGRACEREDYNISSTEIMKVFKELAEIDKEKYRYEWEPHVPIAGSECKRHFFSCYIDKFGNVYPCTSITLKVGSVLENSLQYIISNSEIIHKLRNIEKHIKGACATCAMDCYGCRAKPFHLHNDIFGEDPSCWYTKAYKDQ